MLEEFERLLTNKEKRLYRRRLSRLNHRSVGFWIWSGCLTFSFYLMLTMIGILVSARPTPAIMIGLMFAAAFITFIWNGVSERLRTAKTKRRFQQVLDWDRATEIRIASERMVEFEEYEDEGACYAFELPGNKIVFVDGQDFYSTRKFPNSDFSLVYVQTGQEGLTELFIETRGHKLLPQRTISREVKWDMEIPGHLEVVDGRLDDLEQMLLSRV